MLKKRYWLERKNPRKGRDKKTHGKTGGERRQGWETGGMKGVLSPRGEDSQASLH